MSKASDRAKRAAKIAPAPWAKGPALIAAEKANVKILMQAKGYTVGDFLEHGRNTQMTMRMRQQMYKTQTPEEKAAADKRIQVAIAADDAMRARIALYNSINTGIITLEKAKAMGPEAFAQIEKFRELDLANYWPTFFEYLPALYIANFTKFRFNWGPDGKPRFIPMTLDSWRHFFGHPDRTKWVLSTSSYVCGEKWVEEHARDKYKYDADSARKNPNTSPAHVRAWDAKGFRCNKPKKSLWVKIRKVVVGAAAIVAAVYLGPAALAAVQNGASAMTGGLIPAAGGGAGAAGGAAGAAAGAGGSGAAAAATTGSKVLQGAKTLVGYVNKANTIKAIAKGELPPPPIGIGGSSFGQWAMIVAKEKIKEEAMDAAMEAGQKYVAKKMTEKEEKELEREIAEMQRQLLALTPKEVVKTPPMPDPELAAPVKKIQQIEVKQAAEFEKYVVPGLIVAGALMLGG